MSSSWLWRTSSANPQPRVPALGAAGMAHSPARGGDRLVHVRGLALGDLGEGLLGRRIQRIEAAPRDGRPAPSADQGIFAVGQVLCAMRGLVYVTRCIINTHNLLAPRRMDGDNQWAEYEVFSHFRYERELGYGSIHYA
ncbi:MAG TPA: hypothetical protein VET66_02785 [Steroidobacteraceae bacterium]|nr:hypothetical protein [Candidatus Dormibacteraeota bacterium]HYM27048.1 hypothetical protein [Steroidobacteraceae bacterium]